MHKTDGRRLAKGHLVHCLTKDNIGGLTMVVLGLVSSFMENNLDINLTKLTIVESQVSHKDISMSLLGS